MTKQPRAPGWKVVHTAYCHSCNRIPLVKQCHLSRQRLGRADFPVKGLAYIAERKLPVQGIDTPNNLAVLMSA